MGTEGSMAGNFNYISFGNWEYVDGSVDSIAMGRGRMFEYTPSDIAARLENLDEAAAAFLEGLPAFLCSEIQSGDADVSMLIKYGRVSKIATEGREVSATFETLLDFGEVRFDNVEAAGSAFGADRFQLYRTHWAVREGDAQTVLAHLVDLKPEFASRIARLRARRCRRRDPASAT